MPNIFLHLCHQPIMKYIINTDVPLSLSSSYSLWELSLQLEWNQPPGDDVNKISHKFSNVEIHTKGGM